MIKTVNKILVLIVLFTGLSLSSSLGADIREQLTQEFQLPQDSVFPAHFIQENTLSKEYYSYLKGIIYKNDEDYPKAIDSFWEGINADTTEPRFYQEISEINYLRSDYTTALAFVRLALQQDPNNARSHLLLGTIYARQNKHPQAIAELELSISLDSEQPNVESLLGDEYLKSAKFDEAIVHLEKSTLTNTNDIVSYFQLGNLYLFKMEFEKSVNNFQKVLRLNPTITMARINMGTALESLNRTYEAESAYQIAIQQEPDNLQAYERLGSIHLEHKEYALATTELYQVLVKDSKNIPAQLKYGQALFYLNDLAKAKEIFDSVLVQQKYNDIAKLYRGFILHLEHQPEEALVMFTSALMESTQQDDTYTVYYDYFLQSGRQKEGIYYLEKIRTQFPQEWINDYYIGISYSSMSTPGSAIKYLQSGIAKNPKEFNLWFHLGVAYHLNKQINDAVDAFKKAIDLNPRDPEAYNYCGFMLANEGMRLKEAQTLVEKAHELAPHKAYILDSLAWVYYHQENYKEALDKVQEALLLSPDDPEVLIHLGDIQKALGNKTTALEAWEKAYKYLPGNSSLSEKINQLKK